MNLKRNKFFFSSNHVYEVKLHEVKGRPTQQLTVLIKGRLRNIPRTGTRRKKFTATGKNPLQQDKY